MKTTTMIDNEESNILEWTKETHLYSNDIINNNSKLLIIMYGCYQYQNNVYRIKKFDQSFRAYNNVKFFLILSSSLISYNSFYSF